MDPGPARYGVDQKNTTFLDEMGQIQVSRPLDRPTNFATRWVRFKFPELYTGPTNLSRSGSDFGFRALDRSPKFRHEVGRIQVSRALDL